MAEEKNKHSRLLQWAKDQGVTVTGIAPATIPSKGLGMLAKRKITQGERLISVPASALLFVNPNVQEKDGRAPAELSVHGRLAAAIAFPHSTRKHFLEEWRAIMPSHDDMRASIPAFWTPKMQALLPHAAQTLLQKQCQKLHVDIQAASEWLLHGIALDSGRELSQLQEEYRYSWLLVNTRCFYWDYPGNAESLLGARRNATGKKRRAANPARRKTWPRDDCMAMCPVLDYFNHADSEGCTVTFNERGFTVTADRDYALGEEITISYGKHSNDFLLVEYGFTMTPNTSDHLPLDHLLLPRLNPSQTQRLSDENLLGNYVFSPSPTISTSTCHRTQCALRILLLPNREWSRFVAGLSDGEAEQSRVDELCAELLREYLALAEQRIVEVGAVNLEGTHRAVEVREALMGRWQQVRVMIEGLLQGTETGKG